VSIADSFRRHQEIVQESCATLVPALDRLAEALAQALQQHHKLLVCGNGGSAADAQHFACELVGRRPSGGAGLAALALGTDAALATAVSNDLGFEQLFARQIEAVAQPGDVLLVLTTSGTSPNIVAAARQAKRLGCRVAALCGNRAVPLLDIVDWVIAVPSSEVARIQEVHALCLHALAEALDQAVPTTRATA